MGLLGFGAAWLEMTWLYMFFMAMFFVCWFIFMASWIGVMIGNISGRYRGITEKPWREQIW
jgi:hypothetical protein